MHRTFATFHTPPPTTLAIAQATVQSKIATTAAGFNANDEIAAATHEGATV